ncbi:MAG TPA: MFS transporter, partial [Candidatus Handelsmanbacteria bacterium]|nr:MFS transporter [Candidatus Handelsmanbacteria bacterium]
AAPAAVGAGAAAYGWPESVIGYGIFGIVAGVILFVLLPADRVASAPNGGVEGETSTADSPATPGWGIVNRRGYATLVAISMIDSGVRLGFLTFLPFLLIEKGSAVEALGVALALVFAGGAAGKLVCGFIAERVGVLRTVLITEIATGVLMAAVILLPLGAAMVILPLFGVALNGTSSALYGTIGDFVDGDRQARAYGLFYTCCIGAPIPFGMVSDQWGVSLALGAIATCLIAILPLCQLLRSYMPR